MNGFGYDPMGMYPSSPYNYGGQNQQMQNQQMQNQDPNQQEQQTFADHLRVCISGLSAITGISYGVASLYRVISKTIGFFNIFKGRKETISLLDQVWRQSVKHNSHRGFMATLKYFLVGLALVAYATVHYFIHRKKEDQQEQTQCEEEEKLQAESMKEKEEISLDDFMLTRNHGK
jgi:hypothetical protein